MQTFSEIEKKWKACLQAVKKKMLLMPASDIWVYYPNG
jgi:hypothetical protein